MTLVSFLFVFAKAAVPAAVEVWRANEDSQFNLLQTGEVSLGSSLSADDECAGDDSQCALSALQLRGAMQSAASIVLKEEVGCHTMIEGDTHGKHGKCAQAIHWARTTGLSTHPEWYPGMNDNSSTVEWQVIVYNSTHPNCPRPCTLPAKELWCKNVTFPKLWAPDTTGEPMSIKVLSYNLFWWNLFEIHHGGGAPNLIKNTMSPPYDIMGLQECENVDKVFGPTGLLSEYTAFNGTHAICMAFKTSAWSLDKRGETDVAEDVKTEYYGTRGTQWMRLVHKKTGKGAFFINHHGPLSVNSGGICGGKATARNLLTIMAVNAKQGDSLILVGDFNANAASITIQSLWQHLNHIYNSISFGGVDNIFSNIAQSFVTSKVDLGSGGSDHHAISVSLAVGSMNTSTEAAVVPTLPPNCHDTVQGDTCWQEVMWAKNTGIHIHPEWYAGLSEASSVGEFQNVVHSSSPDKCSMSCTAVTLGAYADPASTASGPELSLDILQHARGADGCLIEPGTKYVLAGGWTKHFNGVADPRPCCQICQHHQGCKAWIWSEWADAVSDSQCTLAGGDVVGKEAKAGFVSGLPKSAAISAAKAAESAVESALASKM